MRSVSTFTLPVITFSTLLAVVACGPSKDHVTVNFEGATPFSKAVDSCQGELKSSQKQIVEQTVKLCRLSDPVVAGEPGVAASDRSVEQKLELVDQTYFYEISKGEDKEKKRSRLQVRFKVGLVLPSGLTEKDEDTVLKQMEAACGTDLNEFYKRSTRRVPMQIRGAYFVVSKTPSVVVENYNELALQQTAGDSTYPGYEMSAFKGGAKFYPVGEVSEKKRCGSISGSSQLKQKCEYDAFLSSNRRFCRQLAKMTGVWLGLADEATERKACGISEESGAVTPAKISGEAPKAELAGDTKEQVKAKRSGKSQFMKSASEQDPTDFFKSAALSNEDLATVLSDSCAGLSQMLAPSPTPTAPPAAKVAP